VDQLVDIEDDTFHGRLERQVKSISNWFAPKRNRITSVHAQRRANLGMHVEVLDETPLLRIASACA